MTIRATVLLRSYWYSRRKPSLSVIDMDVEIRLPGYFGRRSWRVPVAAVAATNLQDIPRERTEEVDGDEVVFAKGITMPYFFTTGPMWAPNLLLQFREPQRLPALGWVAAVAPNTYLPFSRRQSRSAKGAHVDGILLRARDSTQAVRDLRLAGVETTSDPEGWLAVRRSVVSDPAERDEAIARETRAAPFARAARWLGSGSVAAVPAISAEWSHLPSWIVALPAAGLAAAEIAAWRARRLRRLR